MRVLILTHRLPYAPNRGDRLRAYHVLQHLRTRAEVELVSLVHDEEEATHVAEVRAFVPHVTALRVSRWRTRLNACAALATHRPLTHSLLDAAGMTPLLHHIYEHRRPDVVLAYCSGMARFALQPPLDRVPLVLDFVDVDSGKWRDLAAQGKPPLSWIYRHEAATLGAFEARAAARARACLVVNGREAELARGLTPLANVKVLSNGVELDRLRPSGPPSANPRVVFCGVMNYAPNDQGITWFVRHVWPIVRVQYPQATLAIVGSEPSQTVRNFSEDASVTVTGRVPDVRDWLWESAVGIAPLHVARGVQNKALEAIAAGLPIVITPAVAGGLPPEVAPAMRVADTPERFAEHVTALLRLSPDERRAIAASADLNALAWSRTLEPLLPILERATGSREPHAPSAVAPIAWPSA
jgi:sugar transferase (PEP-CTERM/EpsH1 system associated)